MKRKIKMPNKFQSPEQEYYKEIDKILTNLPLGLRSSGFPNTEMKIHFPDENKLLSKSDYSLNEKKNLIHFTSLKAF